MTISWKWRRNMQEICPYRGDDASADHYLVIGKFKARIAKPRRPRRGKGDVLMFQSSKIEPQKPV